MPDETKEPAPSRFGVFGDVPQRLLRFVLPAIPWFLEPVLIVFWTTVFFLIAAKQRRAVTANLRAMHPAWDELRAVAGAWVVFHEFSLAFADAQRCSTQSGSVSWEIEGREHLDELTRQAGGVLIVTAHMGNYDLAASYFASRFPRALHVVRAPERQRETQRLKEREIHREHAENPSFRSHFNKPDSLLGVELVKLIREGNAVAVQADRVVFDISPMECAVAPGLFMTLPKGPLALAKAAKCPCYPLFVTRTGWRRYRISVLPEFAFQSRLPAAEEASLWATNLYGFASRNWRQWFVFEPMLARRPAAQ